MTCSRVKWSKERQNINLLENQIHFLLLRLQAGSIWTAQLRNYMHFDLTKDNLGSPEINQKESDSDFLILKVRFKLQWVSKGLRDGRILETARIFSHETFSFFLHGQYDRYFNENFPLLFFRCNLIGSKLNYLQILQQINVTIVLQF